MKLLNGIYVYVCVVSIKFIFNLIINMINVRWIEIINVCIVVCGG